MEKSADDDGSSAPNDDDDADNDDQYEARASVVSLVHTDKDDTISVKVDFHPQVMELLGQYPNSSSVTEDEARDMLRHMVSSPLLGPKTNPDSSSVQFLLLTYPKLLHECDKDGVSLLFRAVRADSKLAVQAILEAANEADPQGATALCKHQDFSGRTALHEAVYCSASESVVDILTQTCPEAMTIRDCSGETPFETFCSDNGIESLRDLRGSPVTPYLEQLRDRIRPFFKVGPHLHATRDGRLSVHAALYTAECPLSLAHFLIVTDTTSVSVMDRRGNLPLHILVSQPRFGHVNDLQWCLDDLLWIYPDGAKTRDANGELPLSLACRARCEPRCIRMLVGVHSSAVLDLGLGNTVLCHVLSLLQPDALLELIRNSLNLGLFRSGTGHSQVLSG